MQRITDRIDPRTIEALPPSVRRLGKQGLRLSEGAAQRAKLLRQAASPDAVVSFEDLPTRMAIRLAYETVLLREPEPEGIEHYERELAQGMTRSRMLEIMRGSEEAYFNARVTDLLNSLHLSRCDFVRSLPRARRILDLGGTHQSNRDGAFVHL
ncbi:MAG TPA: DUF4214 domain-containing protein, partial [Acidimicrobiales bacterium]